MSDLRSRVGVNISIRAHLLFRGILIALISFVSLSAQAVVFDMGKEKFGSYLRSTFLPSWGDANSPYGQSSGNNLNFNQNFTNLWSYEFGFLFNGGPVTWRVGLEIIQPPALSGVTAVNSAGTQLYSMNSQITVYTPKIGLEYNIKTWKESRLWIYGEYGYATMTVQNSYNFTSAGTAQYGIPNFREVVTGTQSDYAASVGFETLMSDSSTISIEVGYRVLDFNSLSQSAGVTNFQGAQAGGATALRNDGVTPRDISLTGPYAALNLRIWVY